MQKFQDYYGEEVTETNTTEEVPVEEEPVEESEAPAYGVIHILSPLPPLHSLIAGYINYDENHEAATAAAATTYT